MRGEVKSFVQFLKTWTLPVAIVVGTTLYLTFYWVPQLDDLGDRLSPVMDTLFPIMVFLTLFITFCKVDFHQMRPHRWHAGVLVAQLLLVAVIVVPLLPCSSGRLGLLSFSGPLGPLETLATNGTQECSMFNVNFVDFCHDSANHASMLALAAPKVQWSMANVPILLEAVLTCIIGPSAAAAPVVVGKLGGNISTMTTYTILSSVASALLIPIVFPLIEQTVHVSFLTAFLIILQKVSMVLLLPLALGWIVQHYWQSLCRLVTSMPNLSFYSWAVSLSITTGITVKNIVHSAAPLSLLCAIAVATFVLCFVQFAIGRSIGRWLGEEINAGQALFQKNTALSIWVSYMYLNPVASIGAGCYVLWQNIVNSLEIYYHSRNQ